MENSLEQKLIESLEREMRTLRELISAKDALINELQKNQPVIYPQAPVYPWYQPQPIPLNPINPWLPNQPYVISCDKATLSLDGVVQGKSYTLDGMVQNNTSHIIEKFAKSN